MMNDLNSRYIVFCIDTRDKDHHGRIFSKLEHARDYALDILNEKYAEKAMIGYFVWDHNSIDLSISYIESIGFKGDRTKIEQISLFSSTLA